MSDGANSENGHGEFRGDVKARLTAIEKWQEKHEGEHRAMRTKIEEGTRRNDRWSGAITILVILLGIIGPLLAARLMGGGH